MPAGTSWAMMVLSCSQVSAVLSTPMWEWVLQRFGKRMSAFGICVSEAGSKAWGGSSRCGSVG